VPTRLDLPPPPTVVPDHGGGDSDWVPLISADNDIDAHLLQGRLNEVGIEVRAIKDRSGPVWMHGGSDPWAPVAIWVRRFQLEDSRIVLAELAFRGPAATDAPARTMWPAITWWAAAIVLGVLLTGVGLVRTSEHLERCGFSVTCEPAAVP
jgi:Putative prokaryotic signal transducing protein